MGLGLKKQIEGVQQRTLQYEKKNERYRRNSGNYK